MKYNTEKKTIVSSVKQKKKKKEKGNKNSSFLLPFIKVSLPEGMSVDKGFS